MAKPNLSSHALVAVLVDKNGLAYDDSNPLATSAQLGDVTLGEVAIDQTTPGTTNAVDATNFPDTIDVNSGAKSNSTLRVVLATDQPALTNKLLVTPDLPSGASTAAKQPALGTAGTASADVISVQGVASMTALKVDGSAVTQPVGHGKTIKSVGFSLTADGDLVALVSAKRIKVIAYYFSKAGTAASIYNIRTNNAAGTILAKIQLQSQASAVFGANLAIAAPSFLFASAAGEALYLDVPDAEAVTGFITYFDDDAT